MSPSGPLVAWAPWMSSFIGFTKSSVVPAVGVTSLSFGIAEAATGDQVSAWLGPLNIAAGGGVLVLYLFGKSLLRIAEKWLDSQGEKLIALPTAAELKADKESLFEKLEKIGEEASLERQALACFRETLAATLADHGARITLLERSKAMGSAPRNAAGFGG